MEIQFKDMKGMNVPKYCRKIMKSENFPEILEIYRREMLCLTVDVVKASKLNLDENTLLYKKYDEKEIERLKAWKKTHVSGH